MLDSEGFDKWAELFDEGALRCDDAGEYPFAGYRKLLGEISQRILESGAEDVLDLGFGTGTLLKCLYDQGVRVWGQDYSAKMISIAQEKMPEAKFFRGDLRNGLAEELRCRRYDAIISTYTLHHIPDEEKPAFLQSLLPLLRRRGCIYVGDVAFETREELQRCREACGEEWDDEEEYFVHEEARKSFPAMRFEKFSFCGGLLTLESPVLTTERLILRRWEEAGWRAALGEKPEETRIRPMTIEDYDKVYALWLSTKGMGLNDQDDSREGIRQYLLRNPSTSFVAEEGAEIIGTILSGHDGRRGCIYHLAVRKDHRRQGIASRLLEQALTALRAEGIRKVFLVVFRNNEDGNAFWESQGFTLREDLSYRNKALMEMLRIDT
jgi:putative AdoMet-dependent methyltransferase